MKINTIHDVGDRVIIDRSDHIVGVVLAMAVRGTAKDVTYDVAWFHNGSHCSAWIEEWRIDKWEE